MIALFLKLRTDEWGRAVQDWDEALQFSTRIRE